MNATLLCQHNSLVMIANAALGGNKQNPPSVSDPNVKNLGAGHQSLESAVAAINSAFIFGG